MSGSRFNPDTLELLVDVLAGSSVMDNDLTFGRDDFVDNPGVSTFDSKMEGA